MLYRTTDDTRWGAGTGIDLVASDIDGNFWELRNALNNLIANPGVPVSIASITLVGTQLTFNMSDGSAIGPITLPVLAFNWRNLWIPLTAFATLDIFQVVGVGLFMVLENHISPATFDPNYIDPTSGNPAYLLMFAFAPAENLIYDMAVYYPDLLSAVPSDITYLYQEPLARQIVLPAVAQTGSAHQAYLEVAPSTTGQTFNIYQNDSVIGNITFAIGENVGVVAITADTTFNIGNRLAIGKPLASDIVAAGLSVVFAAYQIVG